MVELTRRDAITDQYRCEALRKLVTLVGLEASVVATRYSIPK